MTNAVDERNHLRHRFAALVESIPQAVWLSGDGGRWTWSSRSWTAYTGLSVGASQGDGWMAAIPPDDRALVGAAWRDALLHGVLDVEHGLVLQPSGETRKFRTLGTPLPVVPGQAQQWLGTCTDMHETKQIEQCDKVPLAELRHSVADVLALVRLALRRTPKMGESVENVAMHVESRLDAVARVQAMLNRRPGVGLDLGQIIAEEALVHAAHEGERVQAGGPAVLLLGRAASMFGLALHELMQNSVQYGALSTPLGGISATWQVDADDTLRFEWMETGVVLPDGPRHRGFGTDLIERMLPYELDGTASLDFKRDSVRCAIVLHLEGNIAGSRD